MSDDEMITEQSTRDQGRCRHRKFGSDPSKSNIWRIHSSLLSKNMPYRLERWVQNSLSWTLHPKHLHNHARWESITIWRYRSFPVPVQHVPIYSQTIVLHYRLLHSIFCSVFRPFIFTKNGNDCWSKLGHDDSVLGTRNLSVRIHIVV